MEVIIVDLKDFNDNPSEYFKKMNEGDGDIQISLKNPDGKIVATLGNFRLPTWYEECNVKPTKDVKDFLKKKENALLRLLARDFSEYLHKEYYPYDIYLSLFESPEEFFDPKLRFQIFLDNVRGSERRKYYRDKLHLVVEMYRSRLDPITEKCFIERVSVDHRYK